MYRDLTDKELTCFRAMQWPCCGSKEFIEGPSGGLMTNISCPRCQTKVNINLHANGPELPLMGQMIWEPPGYNVQQFKDCLLIKPEELTASKIKVPYALVATAWLVIVVCSILAIYNHDKIDQYQPTTLLSLGIAIVMAMALAVSAFVISVDQEIKSRKKSK